MSLSRASKSWEEWVPALLALDRRLMRAVEALATAREAADPGSATDLAMERFAGLYLDPRDVGRLASRPPGEFGVLPRGEAGEEPAPLTNAMAPESRLARYERALGLSPFEADVLLLAMACEVDPKYEKIYAFLQDDVTRKWPTVGLTLGLLCADPAVRLERLGAFGPSGRLARYGLIAMIPDASGHQTPLPARVYRMGEDVFDYLVLQQDGTAGFDAFAPADEQFGKGAKPGPTDELAGQADLVEAVQHARAAGEAPRILLLGSRGSGKTTLVRRLALKLRLKLLSIDLGSVANARFAAARSMGRSLARETNLRPTVVHLVADDPALAAALYGDPGKRCARGEAHPESATGEGVGSELGSGRGGGVYPLLAGLGQILLRLPKQTVIILETSARGTAAQRLAQCQDRGGFVTVELPTLPLAARQDAWREALAARGLERALDDDEQDRLARMFRLGYGSIHAAARDAALSGGGGEALWEAARHRAAAALGDLAERMDPHAAWDDLVVTGEVRDQLEDIVRRAEFRDRVMTDWGFGTRLGHGKGTNALFAGPPGTGKTLAAEVLSARLGLPLFRVDSSAVVSKYIGETEKNLEQIFQAAEDCDAVLFFDEADALFGKRTEVQDAHDRYANLETAYLLQRAERHDGLILLATNLVANMDPAFSRRLAHVVHFSFPDAAQRHAIWLRIWPQSLPLDPDIDLSMLAARYPITGGSIKNAAVGAAYLAASEPDLNRRRVTMDHVMVALAHEYRKMGKHPDEVFTAHNRDKARVRLN